MINPNRDTTHTVLQRLKEGSMERFHIQLFEAIRMQLVDFDMTWEDLADRLQWKKFDGSIYSAAFGPIMTGVEVKNHIGSRLLDVNEINEIAHVFSAEPYIIIRPRKPYTQT